jgi:hypothetical protein
MRDGIEIAASTQCPHQIAFPGFDEPLRPFDVEVALIRASDAANCQFTG